MMDNRITTHKFGEYQFNIIEDYTRAIVELEHPDYSGEYYIVAVSSPVIPLWSDDEGWEDYYKGMRKAIEERFNKSGYWHEVKITLEFVVDGKIYRREI